MKETEEFSKPWQLVITRCDKGVPMFRGETGSILGKWYAGTDWRFLSYMLSSYTYLLINPFPTLYPFHSCLNEPPPSLYIHR
ncbi:hypothetical protein Y032_0094g2781 [Ancylostoma ceylanicum]|uniref:Uncharacterized protein n=1 Tax=Ancylostoma ceylanicum TaxID=53326 RepID=A0A016TLN8_9BILA|nr:hypothetical protein Y032_0094g2781 [Ancylostoma ceylanicum]